MSRPSHRFEPTPEQAAVAAHSGGPLLVTGVAGSGRSSALVARVAALARSGADLDRVLVLTRSRAGAAALRERARHLVEGRSDATIETWEAACERLLRRHSAAAGLDPFFTVVSLADRLAMMLDRLDELPLRRHEIRGNPSGLLAGLLRRIDVLKADGVGPTELRDHARAREHGAGDDAAREAARRELDFAAVFDLHEQMLSSAGSLDSGGLVLELGRLVSARADVCSEVCGRVDEVIVDELEDTGAAHVALADQLASDGNVVAACDVDQGVRGYQRRSPDPAERFRTDHPGCAEIQLRGRPGAVPAEVGRAVAAIAGRDLAHDEPADPDAVQLWRCRGERAEAQAVAREIERVLGAGETRPEQLCVAVASGWRSARLVAAALEERNLPYRFAGDAALFERPEVRDLLAWLRSLADPGDSPAVVRALTRPPVSLGSADLARCTTIARRRKLDMVSALEAALESPQVRPEARDKIAAFLRLHRAASAAIDDLRPDVFVRRLIERVGIRRQRLFEATPEAAERLVNLSVLAERAADWARREPRASTRDFVRHVTAVADATELTGADPGLPAAAAVLIAEPRQLKGQSFERVLVTGLHHDAPEIGEHEAEWVPAGLPPGAGQPIDAPTRRLRLAYVAASRARSELVLSWPEGAEGHGRRPAPAFAAVAAKLGLRPSEQTEELFGPAESLHSTYRTLRDEVLEESWRTGSALSEMRLDTAADLDRAVARFLELVKVAALTQRPEGEPAPEAIKAINELIERVATPVQRELLASSALDALLFGDERAARERRERARSGREPSLEQFIPRRGEGLALSASDIDLYRICPLRYKFARVFAIPTEPTINQRFGILVHKVLERFHDEELGGAAQAGTLGRLLALFEAGWRRSGFGSSDDELQYRDRAVAALTRYHERHAASRSEPRWLERGFAFEIGPHRVRGRVDRVDQRPDGSYELIDYKTGGPREPAGGEVQIGLYRIGARESWGVEASVGSYWHVLDDERIEIELAPDETERVERTVLEVAAGIDAQDFEPRPDFEICSACDFRLLCPASEA